jgi:hypothetical protein
MSLNVTESPLTLKQEKAAVLVATDGLTDEKIAVEVGVTKRTLERWKKDKDFAARVRELIHHAVDRLTEKGIAEKSNRIAALVDRQKRMRSVIDARAKQHEGVPGGESGLLVKETRFVKVLEVKRGKDGGWPDEDDEIVIPTKSVQPVDYYAVDTGLLKEMRETEKQAAQEIGDWTEKFEFSGNKDSPLVHEHRYEDLRKLPPDEIARLYRESLGSSGKTG